MIITYHGRIHKEKGLDLLCCAAQNLSQDNKIHLILIGPYETGKGGSGIEYVNILKRLCPDVEISFPGGISDPQALNEELSNVIYIVILPLLTKGKLSGCRHWKPWEQDVLL